MPTRLDKDKVIIEEHDKWYRFLVWTYYHGHCHRSIMQSPGSQEELEHREVGEHTFALAFWRNWKEERGIK